MKYIPLLLSAFAILFIPYLSKSQSSSEKNYFPGELLVQVETDVEIKNVINEINRLYPSLGLVFKRKSSETLNVFLLSFDEPTVSFDFGAGAVGKHPSVTVVQPNYKIQNRKTPNDPNFGQQWQYMNTGQGGGTSGADIDADKAWDITTGGKTLNGDDIVACIIDDGVAKTHPDLKDNLWINKNEVPNNNSDDDGNGFVDDYLGWNAYDQSDDITGGTWGGWHGTSVAGVVGARGNNGVGVAGVNWDVRLMIVVGGGNQADALAAYDYPLKMRKLYNSTNGTKGAFVVSTNASWGLDNTKPSQAPLWCAMYDSLGKYGILNAGATTNNNSDVDVVGDIPTSCPSDYVISVTNTTKQDVKANPAGYGKISIDLGAPGEDTYTTDFSSYGLFGGTSGASPHVAGAIALLYADACPALLTQMKSSPGNMASLVKKFILDGTDPLITLQGITVSGGRLNLYKALLEQKAYCNSMAIDDVGVPENTLKLFPNPSGGKVNIRTETPGTLRIHNCLGELVCELRINGNSSADIEINSGRGIYAVSLHDSGSMKHKMFRKLVIM